MADSDVKVEVNPTTTLIAPPINTEPIAAALLKSSENQAAATLTLAAALAPAREPSMAGGSTNKSTGIQLALVALIVFLLWK